MEKNINEIITNWESEINNKKNTLYKYDELTIEEIEIITKTSVIINKFLLSFINEAMTEDEIIKKYGENNSSVLISYALINNLLNEPVIENNMDTYCSSDGEKMYWQDINRLEVFSKEKTDEYHAKYLEYLNLYNEADTLEEKKKYEKKFLFYRNSIIEGNLRLVISAIKKYHSAGMQYLDLINEGNIGLLKAVEKFDPSRGYNFSTYAYASVRRHVARAIADQSRVIRQPVHFTELAYHVREAREEFYNKNHRDATAEELSVMLDGMPVEKIKDVLILDTDTVSLDSKVHNADENDDSTLATFIASEEKSPEEIIFRKEFKEEVKEMLTVLTDREKLVIEQRWGLNDGKVKTLEDVGKEIGVTRERVRQIEVKAFRKLKKFATSPLYETDNRNKIYLNSDNIYKDKNLIDILEFKKEDYVVFRSRLDKNSKIYEILLLLFGKDFNEVYNPQFINDYERKLFYNYIIKVKTQNDKVKKKFLNKNIHEISNLPIDCIECYLKEIGKNDPRYIFLKKLFGNRFNHRLSENEITIENVEKINYIISELKKMFVTDDLIEKSGYQNKTLMGILNVDEFDVEWLMNNQNKLTKSYEIIVKAFGYDGKQIYNGSNLVNSEKNVLFALLKAWKRKIVRRNMDTADNELIIDDEEIIIKKQIKNDLLPEIIKMLPVDCRMILGLSLGVYNEKAYSVKELAFFYKKDEEEVIRVLKKALHALEEILEYYKKVYNGKMNYSDRDLSILKRVQEIKRN